MPGARAFEKSMLVMSTKPSSYICAESSELPQPTTRTRPPAGQSGLVAASPGASAPTAARSSGRSCAHSLYHSNGTAPRCSGGRADVRACCSALVAARSAARRRAKPCLFEEAVPVAQAAELLELVRQERGVARRRRRRRTSFLRRHGPRERDAICACTAVAGGFDARMRRDGGSGCGGAGCTPWKIMKMGG